jgi:hypothetical protein
MDYLPPKEGEALARNKKKGGCKNLREDVNNPKNWPTPQASEGDKITGLEKQDSLTKRMRFSEDGQQDQQKSSTTGKNHEQLNPNWVEQLMGLQVGWTDFDSSAMELCHKPQNVQ